MDVLRVLLTLALALPLACSDDPPEPATEPEPEPEPEPESPVLESDPVPDDPDPLAGVDDPVDPSEIANPTAEGQIASPVTLDAATPDRGCVALTETPVRVWPRAGPATIEAVGDTFVVSGYAPGESGGEQLFLVALSPEAPPRPLRTVTIDPPYGRTRVAPPASVALDEGRLAVVMVDGTSRVLLGELSTARQSVERLSLRRVGADADSRFAPAIAKLSRNRAVAWTKRGATMRVSVAVVGPDGSVGATHDVTPQAMGATAPAFARGSGPAWLLFMDARAGVSPIVGVELGRDGSPAEPRVARSTGTAADRPELAVARVGEHAYAGYTVVGNAATTAVGLLRVEEGAQVPAVALVPGEGYGTLNVSAAAGRRAAVFAADAPKAPPPDSPREIHVRIADAEGPGPVLVVRGPDETARHAAIARRPDGVLGVAFESANAVHVAWVRCDD